MKINEIIPSLIKVSDKLSTTKNFEVVAYLDSVIKKLAQNSNYNFEHSIDEKDLRFANKSDYSIIREASAITLIQISDILDKINPKLANRIDASIKLLAYSQCKCECNHCSLARENDPSYSHCCRKENNCNF